MKRIKRTRTAYDSAASSEDDEDVIIDIVSNALVDIIFPEFAEQITGKVLIKKYGSQWMANNIPNELVELSDDLETIPHIGIRTILLHVFRWYQTLNAQSEENQQRNFSIQNAFQILRWIGPNCFKWLLHLISNNINPNSDYTPCPNRWQFLESQWESPNLFITLSVKDTYGEIRNNHSLYFIRLSTTIPGTLTVDFWNPATEQPNSQRFSLRRVPNNIRDFDSFWRDIYHQKHNIELPSILEPEQNIFYQQAQFDYGAGY